MSEFYEEVPFQYSKKGGDDRESDHEFLRDSWSVRKQGERFIFEYISGELAGSLKVIEVSDADAQQLMASQISAEEIYRKYHVS